MKVLISQEWIRTPRGCDPCCQPSQKGSYFWPQGSGAARRGLKDAPTAQAQPPGQREIPIPWFMQLTEVSNTAYTAFQSLPLACFLWMQPKDHAPLALQEASPAPNASSAPAHLSPIQQPPSNWEMPLLCSQVRHTREALGELHPMIQKILFFTFQEFLLESSRSVRPDGILCSFRE